MIVTQISIELSGINRFEYVIAKQGDVNSRLLQVQLLNNGKVYVLDDQTTARVSITKPDEKEVLQDCTINNNRVEILLDANILAAAGKAETEIVLTGSGGHVLTSATFDIVIVATNTGKNAGSSNSYKSFKNALAAVQDIDNKIAQKATKGELAVERERINGIIAIREGDDAGDVEKEMMDARIDADGVKHGTAGESIRHKQSELKGLLTSGLGIVRHNSGYFAESYTALDGKLIRANVEGENVTLTQIINEFADNSAGAKTYMIDVTPFKTIKVPLFETSAGYGNIFIDENEILVKGLVNTTYVSGTEKEIEVPVGATHLLLTISQSIIDAYKDWYFEGYLKPHYLEIASHDIKYFNVEKVLGQIPDNSEPLHFGISGTGSYLKIDVTGYSAVEFPAFITSQNLGTVFIDAEENYICGYSGQVEGEKVMAVPANAKYILIGMGAALTSGERTYTVKLLTEVPAQVFIDNEELLRETLMKEKNETAYNLVLCAAQTYLKDGKTPFHNGYLFHTWNDNTLWYGKDYNNLSYFGTPGFTPSQRMLAMSPTDNRVIAAMRGTRADLCVFDGSETVVLFADAESADKPMGWLYNSGIEFIKDSDGQEWCIFAEYSGNSGTATGGFSVWRGKYPYTSESDWEKVFYQYYTGDSGADGVDMTEAITHFHMVKRDPWTNYLYLTSGDDSKYSKWWYSTDCGATWTLLTTGETSGYEEHICRCINFIFTADYVYFATDKGTNHCLNRIARDETTGVLKVSSRVKLCDLPDGQATNSICYVETPRGIFMYDRIDIGYESYYSGGLKVQFYSLEKNELITLMTLPLLSSNASRWGGHRGKCYTNYTSGIEHRPAMGFSADSRNIFDIACENANSIGTVFYEIMAGVLRHM